MQTFIIEQNVPIPQAGGRTRVDPDYPFAALRLGNSFVIDVDGMHAGDVEKLRARVLHSALIRRANEQADFAITTRVREEKGKRVIRVWRVALKEKRGRKDKGEARTVGNPSLRAAA